MMSSIIFFISISVILAGSSFDEAQASNDNKIIACMKGIEKSSIVIPPILESLSTAIKSMNPDINEDTLISTIKHSDAFIDFYNTDEFKSQDERLLDACVDFNEDLRNVLDRMEEKSCQRDFEEFLEQPKQIFTTIIKGFNKFDKMYALSLACEQL